MLSSDTVVAVSRARHGDLRWRRPRDWQFAKGRVLVPIVIPDAVAMASAFPLVFAGPGHVPCVFLGQEGGHIDADGAWLAAVMPPMLRAYPFDVIPHGTDLMLTVDEGGGCVTTDPLAAAFFDPLGALTQEVQQIVAFCRKHGDAARRAAPAVAVMQELGLFRNLAAGIYAIDRPRYEGLDDAAILALRRVGALDLILAHFVSLGHLTRRAVGKNSRGNARPPAAPPPRDPKVEEFLVALGRASPYDDSIFAAFLNP